MKSIKALKSVVLAITAAILLSGCAAPKQAIHMDASFDPMTVDRVTVLPVVDLRPDKKLKLDSAWLQNKIADKVKDHKFTPVKETSAAGLENFNDTDFEGARVSWIKSAGPADARYVMVVCTQDISRKIVFGSTGGAQISAYLVDKDQDKTIWYDRGVGQVGQGGLLGMMMVSAMDKAALGMAVDNLMASFPKREQQKH